MTRETFAFGLCRDVCDLKFARARIVDALENNRRVPFPRQARRGRLEH